jgi:hypothetical protein
MPVTTLDPRTALVVVDLQNLADAHTNSIERIFPRLGETGTTAEILALLP